MKKENRYGGRLARAGSHGWDTLRKRIRMLLPELSTDSGGGGGRLREHITVPDSQAPPSEDNW